MVCDANNGIFIIKSYLSIWRKFKLAVKRIDALCSYLNKTVTVLTEEYSPNKSILIDCGDKKMQARFKPVGVFGLYIWKVEVLEYAKKYYGNIIINQIFECIERFRQGEHVSLSVLELAEVIQSYEECDLKEYFGPVAFIPPDNPAEYEIFDELDVRQREKTIFERDFEEPLLGLTKEYYEGESAEMIESKSIIEYIRYAEDRLGKEMEFAKILYPSRYNEVIVDAVEKELILRHSSKIQGDFSLLLEQGASAELGTVFRLLQRIPEGINPLLECFETFVTVKAQSLLEKISSRYQSEVETSRSKHNHICSLYVSFLGPFLRDVQKSLVDCIFKNDDRFGERLAVAFKNILSTSPPLTKFDSGQVISEYFDKIMLGEVEPSPECYSTEAIETSISDAIMLVKHLPSKDSFIDKFILDFAKRFLFRISKNGKLEGQLIMDLANICGSEFRVRVQKMNQDMVETQELRDLFKISSHFGVEPFDFNAIIPSYVVWPLSTIPDTTDLSYKLLPTNFEEKAAAYGQFYKSKFPNRNITWLHHLSRVVIKYNISTGSSVELVLTVPQAALLNLFQSKNELELSSICKYLQMSEKEVQIVSRPLILSNLLQLTNNSTQLSLNLDWIPRKSKLRLCHYTLGSSLDTDPLSPEGEDAGMRIIDSQMHPELGNDSKVELTEDRKYLLQCLIVKVMKKEQTLSMMTLIRLVQEACSTTNCRQTFLPSAAHVQNALDTLVDKQFIEYEKRKDLYVYLP